MTSPKPPPTTAMIWAAVVLVLGFFALIGWVAWLILA